MNKVVVIGCGNVGMAYVTSLLYGNIAAIDELVLIDINTARLQGEIMDLSHCLAYTDTQLHIREGNYSDCQDATLVCITAGITPRPTMQSRMDDLHEANTIYQSIIDSVASSGFSGIYLVAGNPLDIMTYATWKYANVDTNKVIGSGTCLDTARLRFLLSEKLSVSIKDIDTYVIGEHGNSQLVCWSNSYIGLKPITDLLSIEEQEKIADQVKNAGYEIVNKKGFTNYGVATSLYRITKAILEDENALLCACTYDNMQRIFISTPSIIGRKGVVASGLMRLSESETKHFEASCHVIKDAIAKLGL